MIRHSIYFVIFFSFASVNVQAENISLKFDKVPVTQLLKATYKNLLGQSYGVDASVISNTRLVSLDVSDLPEDRLAPTVDAILRQAGVFKNVSPDGVVFFTGSQGKVAFENSESQIEDHPSLFPDTSEIPHVLLESSATSASRLATQGNARSFGDLALGEIPENFTVYQPKNRPASALQPVANQFLGINYQTSDAVFLSGPSKSVEKVLFLMEQLDQSPSEIFAKAIVVEFTNTTSEGNTFEMAVQALSGKLKISLGSLLPTGENFIKYQGTDLTAILSAVSGDSRFNVVSAPTLRVRDGMTGRVLVGQEVPTLSSTSLDNQGNAQQSIQYRSAGVLFEIKPAILKSRIELQLRQEISDYVKTQSSGIDSPTLTKREINTTVNAQPGELIVLGGLDQSRDDEVERGFSFLPKFARSRASEKTKSQVLIVLQVQRVI
ncbi:type II secretion system protein GspD [Pseudomonas alloputida]|uniref:type II secretion system protein GspD n=1 Tax=Pseudomonas alloputida TaxID=1940621 RepID=UPI003B438196